MTGVQVRPSDDLDGMESSLRLAGAVGLPVVLSPGEAMTLARRIRALRRDRDEISISLWLYAVSGLAAGMVISTVIAVLS